MKIYRSMEELIGHTPLLTPCRYSADYNLKATLALKLEMFNPAGSVKDRAALSMIRTACDNGLLKKGGTIVESTSGNTGIGLAAVAACHGYRVILTMPETMSAERRAMLSAYGAEIVLTEGSRGMQGAVDKAQELLSKIPGSITAGQFENTANALIHYETTGPELWSDTDGKIDCLVACFGTGGTLTGTARYLKEKNPSIHIVAVEPAASPLLSSGKSGAHQIQGIGANFIPKLLDTSLIDEILPVSDEDAFAKAKALVRSEGLLCGISSGAALHAATILAQRTEYSGKIIAAIMPDSGDRYLSTGVYA